MHPQIFINIWFSFVFPLCLKRSVGDTSKFSVLRREKMYKTKTTEWHDELKPTENELKMKICLLILYLNRSNLLILRSAAATPMPHPPRPPHPHPYYENYYENVSLKFLIFLCSINQQKLLFFVWYNVCYIIHFVRQ